MMSVSTLSTVRLRLRPFEERDLEDFHAYRSLPEVTRYLYFEPRDLAGTRELLQKRLASRSAAKDGETLALAIERDGTCIGDVVLKCVSRQHRQGEVGISLHPSWQGKGYATEALRAVVALGFEQLDFHRIAGRCDARNTASAALLQRVGMREEACFVESELFKGEWSSERVFALLAREWRAAPPRG